MIEVTEIEEIEELVGPNNTYCRNCQTKCHENCYFGDDEEKKGCCVMNEKGYCTKCGCLWN